MTMSDRGVHPDLLEEEHAAAAAEAPAPQEPQQRGGRGRRQSRSAAEPPSTTAPPPGTVIDGGPEAGEGAHSTSPADGTSPPEWFQTVRESTDPQAALAAILKNVPLEELQKHPQISGWIGNMAQRVNREQAIQKQTEEALAQKQDAWRRGDYYRLGELTATEQEAFALQQQAAQASAPFMQSIEEYQRALPIPVQEEIQSKTYSSVAAYLQAVHQAHLKHDLDQQLETEIKKRQPALDKVVLSATVGAEPSPERDGGPSPRGREITDVELSRMSDKETELYLDDRGRPLPGVRIRLTRGIDVTRR